MKFSYFPGCTLTNKAKGLNEMAIECAGMLGVELAELENWYCCQADYSMVTDNLMNHLAPVRTLVSARKTDDKLVVLCSTCYYVLKRINKLMSEDDEKRKVVLDFLEEEYQSPVKVIHFLELMRDEIGFEKLKSGVKVDLSELAVAPYYGCQLLRPSKELAFDDPEAPTIFEDFLNAIGCRPVEYSYKIECCGSFLTTTRPDAVKNCVDKIINSAVKNEAEIITTSCPLCNFNLDWSQSRTGKSMPVLYLTELMALAFGVDIPQYIWDEHVINPRSFLEDKGYISKVAV